MHLLKKATLVVIAMLMLGYGGLIAYAYWPSLEGKPAEDLATAEDRFVSVNGMNIRYREYGTPSADKPNIIFVHGFGNNLHSFHALIPLLVNDAYILALDLPGFGLSDKPIGYDYGNRNQSKTVVAFAKSLDILNPIYGGHSMGGAVALHAGLNDDKAKGLLFIDPGILGVGEASQRRFNFFPLPRIAAKQFGNREWRAQMLRRSYEDRSVITEDVIDNLMLASKTDDYLDGMTDLLGNNRPELDNEPDLARVKSPTLAIWGELDGNHKPDEPERLHEGAVRQFPIRPETGRVELVVVRVRGFLLVSDVVERHEVVNIPL